MKGFKRAVSRPQESRALVANLQGELVFFFSPDVFHLLTLQEDFDFACF